MVLCAVPLAAIGCSPRWTLRTVRPAQALQWPYQPEAAKVAYVECLTGLAGRGGAGGALRDIVIGKARQDENAFVLPVAVATGQDGRIAVADMGRKCVHLYLPAERRYLRLARLGDDVLVSPVGLCFDDASRLYVSDSTGFVLVFGADGTGLRVLRTAGEARLERPTGLAFSSRKKLLYVVDTLASRVHALAPDGSLAFSFGGWGEALGQFNRPTHIFSALSGELFVTDSLNFRIEIFDEDGRPVGSFGRHGDGSGDLAMPKGLAVDGDGTVYVVDGLLDNVQLFDRRGDFLLTVGERGTGFGEFWLPSGAFISDRGQLYVCDTYNARVQMFQITERYRHDGS
ncbi:MAG: hypothetical protein U0166_27155 [Acidobacteriota bacterium]